VNGLALFQGKSNGVPAARRGLSDLLDTIGRRSAELERLHVGRRRLRDELDKVDTARSELAGLIHQESRTLLDRIKDGLDMGLAGFGGPRASRIAEGLAASRLQHEIATKTAGELDAEVERLTVELEALRAEKPQHVKAVLVEVASGYRSDLRDIADEMRGLLTTLGALDQLTAEPTGEFVPGRRIVVEIPAIGGMAAQTVAAPIAAVARAKEIWSGFALELDSDPMSTIESLRFPEVSGEEDSGRIIYAELSASERHRVDVLAAHTHHHYQGVKS
jgi:hypothetical protein